MLLSVVIGAACGALAGALAALPAAALQVAARRARNGALVARSATPFKDEHFPAPWKLTGAAGLVVGAAVAAAFHAAPWISALAGAALPALIALASLGIVLRVQR